MFDYISKIVMDEIDLFLGSGKGEPFLLIVPFISNSSFTKLTIENRVFALSIGILDKIFSGVLSCD